MNWKKWTTIALISILVISNFYLILKKDSKIARAEYIEDWRTVKKQNLVLAKEKSGVVVPVEEEYVYYQTGLGELEKFLVREGEEVTVGTPLFTYSSNHIEGSIEQLEAEIDKLESEEDALEETIDDLEKLERSLSAKKKNDEDTTSYEALASSMEAQVYEQELQLSRVKAEIEKYEDLVSISNNSLGDLEEVSTISGVIKEINHDLQNPVVTIASSEQHIVGKLEEEEALHFQEGMKVIISGTFGKKEGTISKVAVLPEQEAQVDTKSEYQYTVEFIMEDTSADESSSQEEETEAVILTGAHVNLKIITKEVEDALTLPGTTIRKGHVYVLKGDGTIEKRPVETGIEVNDIHEIVSDAEEGELAVYQPAAIKNNSAFFTPIDISKMKKKDFKDMGKKEILLNIGRGLLSR